MDETEYQKLGKKALYFFILERSLAALIFLILGIVLALLKLAEKSYPAITNFVGRNPLADAILNYALVVLPALFLAAFGFGALVAYISYSALRYKIDENGFSMEKGIIGKKEISLPFREIQNVDIEQSFVYRIFGMANLIVLTAGHEDRAYAAEDQSEIVV